MTCFRYELQEIALNCGSMLRECARYEALAKIMLNSEDFFNFFRYVEVSTFDIASDAFSTFKVLNYTFFKQYTNLFLNFILHFCSFFGNFWTIKGTMGCS